MNDPFLITGATSGLGLATAKSLAHQGVPTLLGCRDTHRAVRAKQAILAEVPDASLDTIPLDLASIDSVREATARITARETRLAGIICNAGVQIVSGVETSADGYEMTFATNHLGHFQLVTELVDRLGPGARIIVVSSDVHQGPGKSGGFPAPQWAPPAELADPAVQRQRASSRDGRVRYATSKLANVYFAYELADRLRPLGITVTAFDPGLIPETGLSRNYPTPLRQGYRLMAPLIRWLVPVARPLHRSAGDLAWLATAPELAQTTRRYFTGRDELPSAAESYDRERAGELWEVSERLVRRARPA
ncbi:protochlorophyllide reductase [Nocardia tenerifensis]|uniref:Protochlorophyllide reductase n=1 Tax=Nocardia tenerifensis TaxID=228006 RepID=A0A318JPZ9_9NOCA|nr:SDR family NAD(P)-dependent oxidoreductase [Nocardia tenerifensis]PXX55556.1 protochlorophyllide reductase [Nocardia tenerifensis]